MDGEWPARKPISAVDIELETTRGRVEREILMKQMEEVPLFAGHGHIVPAWTNRIGDHSRPSGRRKPQDADGRGVNVAVHGPIVTAWTKSDRLSYRGNFH